eukprot:scaffold34388_cov49-Attheya_sp.AAC.3
MHATVHSPDDATRAAQERVQCAYVLGYEPLRSPWSERQSTDCSFLQTGTVAYTSVINGQDLNTHKRRRSKMKSSDEISRSHPAEIQHDTTEPLVTQCHKRATIAQRAIS